MDIAKLYRRWLFELWYGDYAVADQILTPDVVGHWPAREVHGPQEVAEQIRQSHEMFSDIENTLDVGPIIDGDLCAARWTFHGSYRGGIPGATVAPGTRISFSGHDIFRVENGRFAEYWPISDAMGMMQQLGVSSM
ncbi:ester cyclase [Nocardia transvalensis]|uniref:ester cyclase n=1 Tax=Nocardia transvalensis TaxID=37333 RepID=UPI0018930B27|nr:ester cyclase [Nocardia transvalensis]MBF6330225.1 ester cyclase [Nocardia transvalensis]